MNKILLTLFLLLSFQVSAMDRSFESSMNFNTRDVFGFVKELDQKYNFGIDHDQIEVITLYPAVGEDFSTMLDISYNGKPSKVEYRVYMEDKGSPSIYFYFESKELSDLVSSFMREWAQAKGL